MEDKYIYLLSSFGGFIFERYFEFIIFVLDRMTSRYWLKQQSFASSVFWNNWRREKRLKETRVSVMVWLKVIF